MPEQNTSTLRHWLHNGQVRTLQTAW